MLTKPPDAGNGWLRYLGLAGQFLGIIALAILLGQWLDGKVQNKIPWWSIGLPVTMVVGMLIQIFKNTRPPQNRRP